jgi:hypothetical protein
VREPSLLVEFDDGGLGIGPQLGGGGPEGVGRLQGIAPLNPPVALPALPDMDVELPVDGLARDLDLELLGDAGFVERASTVGADRRQLRFVDFVDVGGGLPMGLGAVIRAGLTAGPLRLVLRRPLGEGGGLALAVSLCLFEGVRSRPNG